MKENKQSCPVWERLAMSGSEWANCYGKVIAALPHIAAEAPVTFCGMGACIDARIFLHDIGPMLASAQAEATAFGRMLQARAAKGKGGELAYDWPDGPTWIAENLPVSYALGGTGPHAAWTLSAIGAPALLALEDRSNKMLGLVPGDVMLAEGDRIVRAGTVQPSGTERPKVYIFEYTTGRSVGDVVPVRSSRIIVRFADLGLENDASFERASVRLASRAGAGLVAGFTAVPSEILDAELRRVVALVRSWRAAGLATVHLELAGYDALDHARKVLDAFKGCVTSLGMSQSEFTALRGDPPVLANAMMSFGDQMEVDRVCVHADHWAASVTKRDQAVERGALMVGSLVASTRAGIGKPVLPTTLDLSARFQDLPFGLEGGVGSWQVVACASPYISHPKTTLGLGDTFTAGCLLALGSEFKQAAPSPS